MDLRNVLSADLSAIAFLKGWDAPQALNAKRDRKQPRITKYSVAILCPKEPKVCQIAESYSPK